MTRLAHFLAITAFSLVAALSAQAEDGFNTLYSALRMEEMLDIMRVEGLAYGDDLRAEMFPGRAPGGWEASVGGIYGRTRLQEAFRAEFEQALDGTEIAPLTAFFTSGQGRRIVGLEISAREALLDSSVEELSRAALERARSDKDARLDLLGRFVEANALVETNVEGALNANYAFYKGLQSGNAFDGALSDAQILSDVWAQEPEIRDETKDWVYSYLLMAYQPLSDSDIEAYITLSETSEGQALNRALFTAYDIVFNDVSRELGETVAHYLAGEDI